MRTRYNLEDESRLGVDQAVSCVGFGLNDLQVNIGFFLRLKGPNQHILDRLVAQTIDL
jgi:hypothetical protein